MYGSSLTGFGLKSSNLNMDLVVPEGNSPAKLLTKVYKLLINCGIVTYTQLFDTVENEKLKISSFNLL